MWCLPSVALGMIPSHCIPWRIRAISWPLNMALDDRGSGIILNATFLSEMGTLASTGTIVYFRDFEASSLEITMNGTSTSSGVAPPWTSRVGLVPSDWCLRATLYFLWSRSFSWTTKSVSLTIVQSSASGTYRPSCFVLESIFSELHLRDMELSPWSETIAIVCLPTLLSSRILWITVLTVSSSAIRVVYFW